MTIQQHNPPHPGELIKRTYIDPFDNISGNQVAKRLEDCPIQRPEPISLAQRHANKITHMA